MLVKDLIDKRFYFYVDTKSGTVQRSQYKLSSNRKFGTITVPPAGDHKSYVVQVQFNQDIPIYTNELDAAYELVRWLECRVARINFLMTQAREHYDSLLKSGVKKGSLP